MCTSSIEFKRAFNTVYTKVKKIKHKTKEDKKNEFLAIKTSIIVS